MKVENPRTFRHVTLERCIEFFEHQVIVCDTMYEETKLPQYKEESETLSILINRIKEEKVFNAVTFGKAPISRLVSNLESSVAKELRSVIANRAFLTVITTLKGTFKLSLVEPRKTVRIPHSFLLRVSENANITRKAHRVLLYIYGKLNFDTYVPVIQTTVCEDIDMDKSSVSLALKCLVDEGVLEKQGTNEYRLIK